MSAPLRRPVTVERLLAQGEYVPPQEADVRPIDVLNALDEDQQDALADLLAAETLERIVQTAGFNALIDLARAIMDRHYPTSLFKGPFRPDADPGAQLVAAMRTIDAVLARRTAGDGEQQ